MSKAVVSARRAVSASAHRAENSTCPGFQAAAAVALESVLNRPDLAAKAGHLRVACRLVVRELLHLVCVEMGDTSVLSRLGEAVHPRGHFTSLK